MFDYLVNLTTANLFGPFHICTTLQKLDADLFNRCLSYSAVKWTGPTIIFCQIHTIKCGKFCHGTRSLQKLWHPYSWQGTGRDLLYEKLRREVHHSARIEEFCGVNIGKKEGNSYEEARKHSQHYSSYPTMILVLIHIIFWFCACSLLRDEFFLIYRSFGVPNYDIQVLMSWNFRCLIIPKQF